MFSTLLDAYSNTRWVGEGKDKTILKCSPNFSSHYAFIFGEPQNFELNDLTIDANKSFQRRYRSTCVPERKHRCSDQQCPNLLPKL